MICILDASAAAEVLLRESSAKGFVDSLEEAKKVITSELYRAEIPNVFWKYVRAGLMEKEKAAEMIRLAFGLVDTFAPVGDYVQEAFGEAVRTGHPVYDWLYLTLARREGGVLLTADRKMKKLAEEVGIGLG
jgi:predicted nucleic acid-binding protein